MGELKWFLLALLGLWVAWIVTGGPAREDSKDPFIEQPAPIEGGQTYGFGQLQQQKAR